MTTGIPGRSSFSRHFRSLLSLCILLCASLAHAADTPFRLNDRNMEAPFCYVAGGSRSWPIATGVGTDADRISLLIRQDETITAEGNPVQLDGLKLSVDDAGTLTVSSASADDQVSLLLEIRHDSADSTTKTQQLRVRPAPPTRPLTYLADFGDDIIRIYGGSNHEYRPITQDGFDQYFRRLQAQGISRLIMWQSPFPYIVDPDDYSPEDWQRYKGQAEAILQDEQLAAGIRDSSGFSAYRWLQQLMALRLMPELGEMISTSAQNHGITLTASFRPFEAALTKYYVIPVFESDGTFLWNFQPLCSPTINYHPEQCGFAHYREVLRAAGHSESGDLDRITLPGVDNAAELVQRFDDGHTDLQLVASPFPPLDAGSFVLVRDSDGRFSLSRWSSLRSRALAQLTRLDGVRMTEADGALQIGNVSLPDGCCYLWLSQPEDSPVEWTVSADTPVILRAAAGNRLGGENVLFCRHQQDEQPEKTRVSGIPPNGHYHAEFQATEESTRWCQSGPPRVTLKDRVLVINIGPAYSVEMMDFTQPAARAAALNQLRTVLKYPAFEDIVINTRSHTQLAGYLGDTGKEVGTLAALYRAGARGVRRIGIDKAYVPRNAAATPLLNSLLSEPDGAERITTTQSGAWLAVSCQTPSTYPWRYLRNELVGQGVRQLLLDLRQEFPDERIQVVVPPAEAAVNRILTQLDTLPDRNGNAFGRDHYRRLWCSNNHIPTIGEGMAMVDLSGTNIEPIFLGTGGYSQDPATFRLYVDECAADLADNRGSTFRGPRSYFYEAQSSLRATDKAAARGHREAVICSLLSRTDAINEVILYEAADWTYFLSLSDPDLCGHSFLDRCQTLPFEP